jgi:hypothetical protein
MSDDTSRIIPFPQSRVPGSGNKRPVKDLGLTPLARQIDSGGRGVGGHWCSRCQGVWYGYFLETECPVCGNRHG